MIPNPLKGAVMLAFVILKSSDVFGEGYTHDPMRIPFIMEIAPSSAIHEISTQMYILQNGSLWDKIIMFTHLCEGRIECLWLGSHCLAKITL